MRLKQILVAIVPTGAAIICLLWAYRRRKVPSLEQIRKPIPTAHSFRDHLATLDSVESECQRIKLPSMNELCGSAEYMYTVEDHNLISNLCGQATSKLLHDDGSCEDFVDPSEQIKTLNHLSNEVIEFPFDVGLRVVSDAPIEVVAIRDGNGEQVERLSNLEDESGIGCMNQSGNGVPVNGSAGKDCLPISEEVLEYLLKQDVADENELFEMHGPSQLMPAKENSVKEPQVATVTKPASAFRKSIGCFGEFDQGTSGSLSDQEMGWRSSSITSQDSAVICFGNKAGGDSAFYNDVSFL